MSENHDTVNSNSNVVTDDNFRSRHIQSLIGQSDFDEDSDQSRFIPLTLIQYWDESQIPSDVQHCMDSWRVTDDLGFERLIFDQKQARAFIENRFDSDHVRAFNSCVHPAMRSDYFRLCYLLQNGGLYVDADDKLRQPEALLPLMEAGVLLLQPLCYRLSTDSMVVPAKFAGEVGDDLIFYVANDPMLAPANHPVIEAALAQATNRLIAADGKSRDIQWLTGPGNLSEILVRHSLELERVGAQPDFRFIFSWVQIAPGDWTLNYRNDDRNWRLWIAGDVPR